MALFLSGDIHEGVFKRFYLKRYLDLLFSIRYRGISEACNELKKIVEVPNIPCNRYLSNRNNQTYEMRRTGDSFQRQSSKTHRHSTSFIPHTLFKFMNDMIFTVY